MDKKGFTLIELLAVIIVLSLIAGIAVTSISKTISNSKQKLKAIQIEEIKKAASKYYMTSDEDIESGNSTCVNVSKLLDEGYFEDDNIEDPTTGELISGSVTIQKTGETYYYTYNKEVCSNG